ncbi:hypothetical protein FY030_06010 [Ornithinimicrobium pratense]|uniref:DUF3071 domain-containing protein n=1 Tax=Ornithinimicrobium pratense TaxID=2593973 RepID=A0A5J6V3W3_9MICO|nr:hypothetical protein FY030_06010 [Ornithinimicrobium pratense]
MSFDEFFALDEADGELSEEDELGADDSGQDELPDTALADAAVSVLEEDPASEHADLPAALSDEPDGAAEGTPADDEDEDEDEPREKAEAAATEPAPDPEPPTRQAGGRKGRPSVPSWDDIMFGARDRR